MTLFVPLCILSERLPLRLLSARRNFAVLPSSFGDHCTGAFDSRSSSSPPAPATSPRVSGSRYASSRDTCSET